MDERQCIRISELLLLSYDGSASPEDIAELEALLTRDRQALEYYVETSINLNYFHCLRQIPLSQPEVAMKRLDGDFVSGISPEQQLVLLRDFAEYEKCAPTIEIDRSEEAKERQPIKKIEYKRPVRTVNRFSLITAVLSTAALLLMVLYVRLAPPVATEVATVSDSINAQWSSGLPIELGTRIPSDSKPIRLTRGIVEFTTDEQVRIVLEAPAEFYFSSYAEVSMDYGRLFARVSEQGYGFSVVTPNLKIVDLGTEFGIVSHIDGGTDVHLYQGKANLLAGQKYERKKSQILTAGSAGRVDPGSYEILEIALDGQALVRKIDSGSSFVWKGQKALRLTDLLLEGDGFGTASREGIEYNPLTGDVVNYGYGVAGYREGPEKMMRIPRSPYLDGIFVPGSSDTDPVISSAGHRFDECPETSGLYYSNIICEKNCTFSVPVQQTFEQSAQQFADSGFLYLHSNIGLTVDLNAVRRAVPGLRIASFSAFAGIIGQHSDIAPVNSEAEVDVWVLVDGQLRSSRQELTSDQGYDIHVDLADEDRFLTLVVTDGGTIYSEGFPANHYDTCGFAEPVFQLASHNKDRQE